MKNLLSVKLDKNFENKYVPNEVYNIGNNKPEKLEDFITIIENELGKKAIRNYLPMQKGDVTNTFANIDKINSEVPFVPKTNIKEGIKEFVKWYLSYFKD